MLDGSLTIAVSKALAQRGLWPFLSLTRRDGRGGRVLLRLQTVDDLHIEQNLSLCSLTDAPILC